MNALGIAILLGSILLSVVIAVISHGHMIFIGLPLLFGLPLAGILGRRRG
jgi:hypothetical protein